MSPTPRLLTWILLVLLLLPGQLAWLYLLRGLGPVAHESILIGGQVLLGMSCVAVLALLRTTPPSAIRLPRGASVLVVIAGTLLLQCAAIVLGASPSAGASGAALCAVAAVALLAVALRRSGESPWHAALLGWNPLLTLAAGDVGVIGVLLLAATLAAAAAHRFKLAGAALALACGVSPSALLLLPFLWRQVHEQRSFRAGRRVVLVFLVTLAGAFVAARLGSRGGDGPFAQVPHVADVREGGALIHESFKSLFGAAGDPGDRQTQSAEDAARLVGLLVVLGMGMLLWQSRASVAEAGYWLGMFGLLFAPAVGPGALQRVLVFIPLVRGPQGFAGLTWAATAALGYAAGRGGAWSDGGVPPVRLVAEYLPVFCVLAVEVLRLARVVPLGRAVQSPVAATGPGTFS